MKTLNQCSKRLGEIVVLNDTYNGDVFSMGDTLMIKGFNITLREEVVNNYLIEGEPFFHGEHIKTVTYIVESFEGKRAIIWPSETENGYIDPEQLEPGVLGRLRVLPGGKP